MPLDLIINKEDFNSSVIIDKINNIVNNYQNHVHR
jgi:hypothetical protein